MVIMKSKKVVRSIQISGHRIFLTTILAICLATGQAYANDLVVTIINADSFGNDIRVYDAVCDRIVWTGYLAEWDSQRISVCASSAGYGTIDVTDTSNDLTTRYSLLSNKDEIKI